jgi:hypothetical protein
MVAPRRPATRHADACGLQWPAKAVSVTGGSTAGKRFVEPMSAAEGRYQAQKIAFGPMVFQCVRIAWKRGILACLDDAPDVLTVADIAARAGMTEYAISILLESCLSAGAVSLAADRYVLEMVGRFVLHDPLTRVNMDFSHDVCYRGMFHLEEALETGRPVGLSTLGQWSTLYEGMTALPEPARTSWFAFDHFYSDSAFPSALPLVLKSNPARLMDIGANSGKWAEACLRASSCVHVTLVDHAQQLRLAAENLGGAGLADRATFHPTDLLDADAALPSGQDVIWMSQFLSCVSEDVIRSIFRRARAALRADGKVFVLDTLWDRQRFDVAAFCLINTSPYFTAIASGCSKMYRMEDHVRCAKASGLNLVDVHDGLGLCHSLLTFAPS